MLHFGRYVAYIYSAYGIAILMLSMTVCYGYCRFRKTIKALRKQHASRP